MHVHDRGPGEHGLRVAAAGAAKRKHGTCSPSGVGTRCTVGVTNRSRSSAGRAARPSTSWVTAPVRASTL